MGVTLWHWFEFQKAPKRADEQIAIDSSDDKPDDSSFESSPEPLAQLSTANLTDDSS